MDFEHRQNIMELIDKEYSSIDGYIGCGWRVADPKGPTVMFIKSSKVTQKQISGYLVNIEYYDDYPQFA